MYIAYQYREIVKSESIIIPSILYIKSSDIV